MAAGSAIIGIEKSFWNYYNIYTNHGQERDKLKWIMRTLGFVFLQGLNHYECFRSCWGCQIDTIRFFFNNRGKEPEIDDGD